ncbi:hypothetical protein Dimus_027137 [Dionaea muscipula]
MAGSWRHPHVGMEHKVAREEKRSVCAGHIGAHWPRGVMLAGWGAAAHSLRLPAVPLLSVPLLAHALEGGRAVGWRLARSWCTHGLEVPLPADAMKLLAGKKVVACCLKACCSLLLEGMLLAAWAQGAADRMRS